MSSLRGEITGRKPRSDVGTKTGLPPLAYSIPEFCECHRISVSFYYELKRDGLAPREMVLGTRRVISAEAAADWRRERETNTTA
jgi:hypothetical protein